MTPAVAVLARILVTLPVKCVAMSSALCRNLDAVGGLDTLLIVDHSCRGLLQSASSSSRMVCLLHWAVRACPKYVSWL